MEQKPKLKLKKLGTSKISIARVIGVFRYLEYVRVVLVVAQGIK